jgi:hypothetical protein
VLRITIESSKYDEKAVNWLVDLLKYKQVPHRFTTSKVIKNDAITHITTFEKR